MLRLFYSQVNRMERGKGQSMLFVVLVILLIVVFFALMVNTGYRIQGKVRAQISTDASVYSGAVWYARGMNLVAAGNQLIATVYIAMFSAVMIGIGLAVLCAITGVACGAASWYFSKLPKILKFLYEYGVSVNNVQGYIRDYFPLIGLAEAFNIGRKNMNASGDEKFNWFEAGVVAWGFNKEGEIGKLPAEEADACAGINKVKNPSEIESQASGSINEEIKRDVSSEINEQNINISCEDNGLKLSFSQDFKKKYPELFQSKRDALEQCNDIYFARCANSDSLTWRQFVWKFRESWNVVRRNYRCYHTKTGVKCKCETISVDSGTNYPACTAQNEEGFGSPGDLCSGPLNHFRKSNPNRYEVPNEPYHNSPCGGNWGAPIFSPSGASDYKYKVRWETKCYVGPNCYNEGYVEYEFDHCFTSRPTNSEEIMGKIDELGNIEFPGFFVLKDFQSSGRYVYGFGYRDEKGQPIKFENVGLFDSGEFSSNFAIARSTIYCDGRDDSDLKDSELLWNLCWKASLAPVAGKEAKEDFEKWVNTSYLPPEDEAGNPYEPPSSATSWIDAVTSVLDKIIWH